MASTVPDSGPMDSSPRPTKRQRRHSSTAAEMQSTIQEPGSIKINVTGAYIIKRDSASQPTTPGTVTPPEPYEYEHDKRDIRLPNHTATISHVAADIGGSLAKIVYFSPEVRDETNQPGDKAPGGRLHFLRFETDNIDACIEFMRELQRKQRLDVAVDVDQQDAVKAASGQGQAQGGLCVMATGGGAFKYYDLMKEKLGVDIIREDEMSCLIRGLDFFINEIPREVFTYDETDTENPMHYVDLGEQEQIYPYLLVNIGSGVSMVKVSGPSRYQRIGGTSLGGGTLWGLLSLLTGAGSFDDMLAMSEKGDNSTVDLLVGDIYGDGMGYEKIGLSERTIASSFGKVFKRKREAERHAEDGSGALLNGHPEARDSSRSSSQESPVSPAVTDSNGATKNGDGRMFKTEDVARSLLYAVRSVFVDFSLQ